MGLLILLIYIHICPVSCWKHLPDSEWVHVRQIEEYMYIYIEGERESERESEREIIIYIYIYKDYIILYIILYMYIYNIVWPTYHLKKTA